MKYFYSILFILTLFLNVNAFGKDSLSNAPITNVISVEIPGLKIFPNPASNVVTIQSDKNLLKDVVIYDVLGKEVLKKTLLNGVLDISNINSGVYIIKITENNSSVSRKLIIK